MRSPRLAHLTLTGHCATRTGIKKKLCTRTGTRLSFSAVLKQSVSQDFSPTRRGSGAGAGGGCRKQVCVRDFLGFVLSVSVSTRIYLVCGRTLISFVSFDKTLILFEQWGSLTYLFYKTASPGDAVMCMPQAHSCTCLRFEQCPCHPGPPGWHRGRLGGDWALSPTAPCGSLQGGGARCWPLESPLVSSGSEA